MYLFSATVTILDGSQSCWIWLNMGHSRAIPTRLGLILINGFIGKDF